jgi:hypothetical protein
MPLPPPVAREPLHTRTVTYQGYERADGLWEIEAELRDTKAYPVPMYERGLLPPGEAIHHLQVRVVLDDEFVIREVHTAMDDTPFEVCGQARDPMQGLVGQRIGAGWRQTLDRVLGGVRGCTHLRELMFNLATAVFQTVPAAQMRRREAAGLPGLPASDEPPFYVGRCKTWDVDGPVVARHLPEFAGWERLRRKDRPAT